MIPREHAKEIAEVLYPLFLMVEDAYEAGGSVITAVRQLCGLTEAKARKALLSARPEWQKDIDREERSVAAGQTFEDD